MLDNQILVVGIQGAGKASVVWSLAPMIKAGTVRTPLDEATRVDAVLGDGFGSAVLRRTKSPNSLLGRRGPRRTASANRSGCGRSTRVTRTCALADYLGHADRGFTLRTYTHLMPSSAERTRKAVHRIFGAAE